MESEERKLIPILPKEVRVMEELGISRRFIEEINRVCLDGRVKSIKQMEQDLLLQTGDISRIEKNKRNVDLVAFQRAKKFYNIDIHYVLYNAREPELAGSYRAGRNLAIHKPFDRKENVKHSGKNKIGKEAEKESL